MFRWVPTLRKLFASPPPARNTTKQKTRRLRPTAKLELESLEDRTLPSVAAIISPPEMPVGTAAATLYNDAIKTVETAISAHQQLADTIRATLEALLQHHSPPVTRFAPPPAGGNPTIWNWSPIVQGNKASNGQNWVNTSNGQRGTIPNGPDSEAVFAGPLAIDWDQSFVFSEMVLGSGTVAYTGTQTIEKNVNVTLAGDSGLPSLAVPVTTSWLNLAFTDNTSVFQIDGTATITNMQIGQTGSGVGLFYIEGGTTKVAPSPGGFTEKIAAPVIVEAGATLNDQSNNEIFFDASDVAITVKGSMKVFFGSGPNNTLFTNNGNQGDYINDADGFLGYYGAVGVTDTFFNVPILVTDAGTFLMSTAAGQTSGKLVVSGGVGATANKSVYLTGPSTVQLANTTALQCINDFLQDGGTLKVTDATGPTLEAGVNGGGTITVSGGTWSLTPDSQGNYGNLNVICSNVNFSGTYAPSINGGTPGVGNAINMNTDGTFTIVNPGTVDVQIVGNLVANKNWVIIDGTTAGNFTNPLPKTLTFGRNPKDASQYLANS